MQDSDLEFQLQRQETNRRRRVAIQVHRRVFIWIFLATKIQVAALIVSGWVATAVTEEGKEVLWRGG